MLIAPQTYATCDICSLPVHEIVDNGLGDDDPGVPVGWLVVSAKVVMENPDRADDIEDRVEERFEAVKGAIEAEGGTDEEKAAKEAAVRAALRVEAEQQSEEGEVVAEPVGASDSNPEKDPVIHFCPDCRGQFFKLVPGLVDPMLDVEEG